MRRGLFLFATSCRILICEIGTNSNTIMNTMKQICNVTFGTCVLLLSLSCLGLATKWNVLIYTHESRGKLEVDTISLLSDDVTCRSGDPILTVSGKDVTWYADAQKKTLLAEGNTFHSASLDTTTTFYVTQRVDGVESDVKAIIIEVVEAFLVDLKTTPAKCGKNDGTIMVKAKGGTDRYPVRFKLDNGPLQTASTFTDLAPGTYKLTLQAAKCTGSIDVKIEQQAAPIIAQIDSVAPQCGKNDGSIRIAAYGKNGTLSYSLNGIDFFASNIFNDLSGGNYMVTVRDDSLCSASLQVVIKKSIALKITSIDVYDTSCGQANGVIKLTGAEGNGTLNYTITGAKPQLSNSFINLPGGIYDVVVTDELGCTATKSVTVGKSQGPAIANTRLKQPACNSSDGQITLSATGPGSVTFSLNSINYQMDSTFTDLPAGKYVVTVKNNEGCIIQQAVKLEDTCGKTVFIPSAFTPNDDGINDDWAIYFTSPTVEIEEMTIFNRWGEVILHSRPGSVTSGATIWDGKYKGQQALGVFVYQLLIKMSAQQASYVYRGQVSTL